MVGLGEGFERLAHIMSKVRATLDNTPLFIAMAVVLALLSAAHFWPTSFWYEVRSIKAGPASVGQSVPMLVDRSVNRSFSGERSVTVRKFISVGWVNYCYGSVRAEYKKGEDLPQDLDMRWWTGGACEHLPEGRYVIETAWTIKPIYSFMPERTVHESSNIFEVTP